jgi:hypothetical protein
MSDWMLEYAARRQAIRAGKQASERHLENVYNGEETEYRNHFVAAKAAIVESLYGQGGASER